MKTICVKIKRIRPAVDTPLPCYMTSHAAGMDLYAEPEEDMVLLPGERALIPTGIAIELPEGYEAQVRPRTTQRVGDKAWHCPCKFSRYN